MSRNISISHLTAFIGFLLATILVEANNFLWMIKEVIVPAKQMLKALPHINYMMEEVHDGIIFSF